MNIRHNSKKLIYRAIVVQTAVLVFLAVVWIIRSRDPYSISIDLSECESGLAVYNNGAYEYDGSEGEVTEVSDLVRTSYFSLPSGKYTLFVDYTASEDQMFRIMDDDHTDWIKYPTGYLRRASTWLEYDFSTAIDLNNARLVFQYLPTGGYIRITGIKVMENNRGFIKWLTGLLFAFVLADCVYINRKRIVSDRNTVIALTGLVFLTSLPLTVSGIYGMDLPYSLLRIDGLYETLINGAFPARMDAFILDGAGYPGSIFYGDIYLYPAALLRMIGFNVIETWKIYVFLINTVTVVTAYRYFERICGDSKLAVMMSFAYCSAPFHLEAIYYRGALGEMVAYIFFPIIAYSLYEIYVGNIDRSNRNSLSTVLAFGVSSILCSHLLSFEMLCILLALLLLVLCKKTFTKDILTVLALSVIKTILISLFYLVPFVEYYLRVPTRISNTVANSLIPIQERGIYISEIFSFLTFFDKGNRVPFAPDGPGLILVCALAAGIVIWTGRQVENCLKVSLIMSVLTLLLASDLFPWDYLISHSFIGRVMSQIQHPTRYISFSVIFMVMVLMNVMTKVSPEKKRLCLEAVICFTIFSISVFSSQYEGSVTMMHPVNQSDLDSLAIGNGEYVLIGCDIFRNPYTMAAGNNGDSVTSMTEQGISMTIDCKAGESDKEIILPRYNYMHMHVYDKSGHDMEISESHKLITVNLPPEYEGSISLRFVEPWYWRLAELLSLITIIYLWRKLRLENTSACRLEGEMIEGTEVL